MRTETIIVDEFYPDPMKVRNYALSIQWQSAFAAAAGESGVHPLDDGTWKTSQNDFIRDTVFNNEKMIRVLETITGEEIDRETWFKKPQPWNGQIHAKTLLNDHVDGEPGINGIHNHTHDPYNGTGANGWAAIVFLNPSLELAKGMFTWSPKKPMSGHPWTMENSLDQFQPMDAIANKFNRLIVGRGDLWHSGADGCGKTLAESRMFQTFFFRTLGPLKELRNESLTASDLPEPIVGKRQDAQL